MSEEWTKLLRRFEERLLHLESGRHEGPAHWKLFHLNNALKALEDDHPAAHMHLNEFDRAEAAREFPELNADQPPSVEEIRSRFDMIAGGSL